MNYIIKACIIFIFSASYYISVAQHPSNSSDLANFRQEEIRVVDLGPQVKETVIQGSVFAKDDKGVDYIYTVVRGEPAHLLGYELKNNTLIVDIPIAKTDGSWDITVSSDGTLYIAGSSGGYLYKHIPGSKNVENLGKVLGTENYIWDLTPGRNAEIFGATYPGCRVFRYHPEEGFSDVGKGPLIEGEKYVRGLAYHEASGTIYAGVGSHAHLIELNVKTGAKKNILPEKYRGQEFVYNIGLVNNLSDGDRIFFTVQNLKKTVVYNIRTGAFEHEFEDISVKTAIKSINGNKVYYTSGSKLFAWDLTETNKQAIELSDCRSSALASKWGNNGDLYLLNMHGDLIKYSPKTGQKAIARLKIPSQPIKINIAAQGPGGKVWTGGYLAGTNAVYDPLSGKSVVYRGLAQTESIGVLGENIYFGIYPHGRVYVYNIKEPWDMNKGNPKKVAEIKGQDRPFGALGVPEINKVFFGTVPTYGVNGGELVEIDGSTEKVSHYAEVVSRQSIITLTYIDKMLIGGSSIWGGLGIKPEAEEAKLFVWDPAKNEKIFEIVPVPKAKAITCLINGPDGKVWGIAAGTLFVFDQKKLSIVSSLKIYDDKRNTALWRPDALVLHPNGMFYGSIAGRLFSLDPDSMKITMLNSEGSHLFLNKEGDLYFSKSFNLWSLKP